MMALLVQKQARPPGTDLASLPPAGEAATARDEWFGVYRDGQKIGHGHRVTARTPHGFRIEDDTHLVLAMLGSAQSVHTTLVTDTDATFALRRFHFRLVSPAATFTASGTSDGRRLEVRYGDAREPLVVPLAEPIALSSTLRPRLAATRPAPGTRYTQAIFNPLTLRAEPITVVVEGTETVDGQEALRISEEQRGVRTRAWLAADGSVLREEGMLGLELRREPRAVALAGTDGGAPLDLAVAARIPLTGTITDPRARTALTLRVSGDMAERIPDDPPRQRRAGALVHVTREPVPAAAPSGDGPDLAPYVRPGPFVESDDPEIVARAREIVAGERDPAARAGRLVGWVHTHLTQEPSLTVPSARDVLRARRGDCNEHAVLLAALARAAGIPARVVAGAVYAGDGFYYHAWNELWLGGWVSADAVFDQLPVDATHVKLVDGGSERQLELAGVLGRLAFATVETDS